MPMPVEFDIDITQDLVDGSDGALADTGVHTPNSGDDAQQALPDGVVHVNTAPEKAKAPDSLRDQLSNAFKGEEAADPNAAAPAAPAKDAPQLTKDSEGKYRQSDGTFASKEQIDAFEAAAAAPAQNEVPAQQEPSYFTAMTPVEREQYNALPAEIQQFVGRTMEAVANDAARYGEYGLLEQSLIGPRRQAWANNGMTPAVALNQLIALSDYATRSPTEFVLWFAEQNKIDLDAALDERDAMQTANPEMLALQTQVQALQAQISGNTAGQQEAQHTAALNEVQTFSLEKDEAGGLRRPYLTDVADTWPAHIQALRTANPTMPNLEVLQKAYEAACWANPNVRGRMQKATQDAARAEAQRKADAARLAGSSINGAATSNGASQVAAAANLGIRETLAAAFAQHAN